MTNAPTTIEILDEYAAAELLDCEPSTVQEKARNGELPAVKYGRSWRFPKSALLEALHAKAMANLDRPKQQTKPVGILYAPRAQRMPPAIPDFSKLD